MEVELYGKPTCNFFFSSRRKYKKNLEYEVLVDKFNNLPEVCGDLGIFC